MDVAFEAPGDQMVVAGGVAPGNSDQFFKLTRALRHDLCQTGQKCSPD